MIAVILTLYGLGHALPCPGTSTGNGNGNGNGTDNVKLRVVHKNHWNLAFHMEYSKKKFVTHLCCLQNLWHSWFNHLTCILYGWNMMHYIAIRGEKVVKKETKDIQGEADHT